MTTLADVRDQIKAIAASVDGSASARFLAVLEAAGITDTATLAQVLNILPRQVRRLRSTKDGGLSGPVAVLEDRGEVLEDRPSGPTGPESGLLGPPEPRACAGITTRATKDFLRKESIQIVKQDPPLVPQGGKTDDLQPTYDRVQYANGRLTLFNGLKAFWLEKFDNDEERLELALVQAAGFVQPNSTRPLEAQVSSQLARSAADKLDRDKRYAAAAKASGKPPKSTEKPISLSPDRRAELERRAEFYRQLAAENDVIRSGGTA